ncbi:hypothetical protein O6P43_000755 [Quillaja saponaria]|uniref:Uncharacterized protein n=1 Tax=Quillaja saponaria TaxID=32244 RepID=A0AAD7QHN5_QUISA|nr:hypothetical protein O6P43_000755 [Quillaja saponaria]
MAAEEEKEMQILQEACKELKLLQDSLKHAKRRTDTRCRLLRIALYHPLEVSRENVRRSVVESRAKLDLLTVERNALQNHIHSLQSGIYVRVKEMQILQEASKELKLLQDSLKQAKRRTDTRCRLLRIALCRPLEVSRENVRRSVVESRAKLDLLTVERNALQNHINSLQSGIYARVREMFYLDLENDFDLRRFDIDADPLANEANPNQPDIDDPAFFDF